MTGFLRSAMWMDGSLARCEVVGVWQGRRVFRGTAGLKVIHRLLARITARYSVIGGEQWLS